DKVDEPEYYGKECTECSACHAHENEGLSGHLIQRNELFRLAFNRWCLFSWPPAEFTDFHCTVQLIHFIVQNGLDGLCLRSEERRVGEGCTHRRRAGRTG